MFTNIQQRFARQIRKLCTLVLLTALLTGQLSSGSLISIYAEPSPETTQSTSDSETTGIGSEDGNSQAVNTDWPAGPEIFAECGVLVEASTGTVLYDKKANQQMYPASITKIMTTLLALENCNLDEVVEFSHYAVFSIEYGAAHISRDEGELLSMNDCLYAVMLASANEVSNAVGEHIAKKQPEYQQKIDALTASGENVNESLVAEEVFSSMMNERAKQCGALNTHFSNPHGLFKEDHWTTCYDMAMITREAIKLEQFLKIESQTSYIIPTTNKKNETLPISNRHKMLFPANSVYYEGILGGKTGYVDQSGSTLVTFARRNGMTLISVVMRSNGENVYNDTKLLLDYGFTNFSLQNIAENEKNFTPNSHSPINPESSIFSSSAPLITMNQGDNVVLPNGVPFSCCKSSIRYLDHSEDDSFAVLNYTLNDRVVGSTVLSIHNPEEAENTFEFSPAIEKETTTEAVPEKETIHIDLKLLILVTLIILIVGLGGYYFYVLRPSSSNKRTKRKKRRRSSKKDQDYVMSSTISHGFKKKNRR